MNRKLNSDSANWNDRQMDYRTFGLQIITYSQGALVTFNTNLLRKGLTLRLYLGVW